MRKLRPVTHRVLVKLKKDSGNKKESDKYTLNKDNNMYEEKSGSFVLSVLTPSEYNKLTAREQYGTQEAYVMAFGMNVNVGNLGEWEIGDLVMIARYSGEDRHDIEEGEIYRVINDEDIFAVYDGENINV